MAKAAELIIQVLDRHLRHAATIRLMGGAALILAYGLDRATEDADLLLDDQEAQFLVEQCDFGTALEATNRELEPRGLYLSHIWGPEQQILTPEWRANCRPVSTSLALDRLRLETLGPLDLIVSKLARADDQDLEDMRHLIQRENLSSQMVLAAIERATVPPILAETYQASRTRVARWMKDL